MALDSPDGRSDLDDLSGLLQPMEGVGDRSAPSPGNLAEDPLGRASVEEVETISAALDDHPLVRALMWWSRGWVIVLNQHRQIVHTGDEFARLLGFEDASALLGLRLGETMGCVNVALGPDQCGTGRNCRFCNLLGLVTSAQRGDERVETECRLTLLGEDGPRTRRYHAQAMRAVVEDQDLVVVHLRNPKSPLQPVTGASIDSDEQPSSLSSIDGEWPMGLQGYTLVQRIGDGSMGSVYLIEDGDGQPFALKTIRATRATDPKVLSRFEREVELSMQLQHPHIVRTVRFDRTTVGDLFMVSEYCGQGSASDWLQRMGPLPVDLALYWMTSISHALGYAWREHQLIHRDIKPDNLLVDDGGMIKLADFGIALRRQEELTRLTQEGHTLGSVHFMAPEQIEGVTDLDIRADMYSLGSTFFKLLTGLPPIDAPELVAIMRRKITEDAPSVAQYRSSLPPGLVHCLDGLLARDRDRRLPDPETLSRQLVEVVASEGVDLTRVHKRYHLPDVV